MIATGLGSAASAGSFTLFPPLPDTVKGNAVSCPVIVENEPCTTGLRIVRGKCIYHYRQERAGKPYTKHVTRRANGTFQARDEFGRKLCGRCEVWQPPEAFSHRTQGEQTWCNDCCSSYMLERRYGITRSEMFAMLQRQGGGCAICGTKNAAWHVDHNHACCAGVRTCGKCIRGILCSRCNHLLGEAQDDPVILLAALRYVEKHQ